MGFNEPQFITNSVIQYRSLSDMTADIMSKAIIKGEIPLGTRITETEIADSLGVSRIVVREAVFKLISKGLMIKEKNRWTTVTPISKKDVEDILDLRIAIEQAAAKRCLSSQQKISKLQPKLHAISNEIDEISSASPVDQERLLNIDMSFHHQVLLTAGNDRLLKVWDSFSGLLFLLLYRYIASGSALHYSHKDILHAFDVNNIQLVTDTLFEHIQETKHALLQVV